MRETLVLNLQVRVFVAVAIEVVAAVACLFLDYPYWRWFSVATAFVFCGAYRSWKIGLAFFVAAAVWAVMDLAMTPWIFGYRLDEVILMKRRWTGTLAFPCGIALSSLLSMIWGAVAGDLTSEAATRNGAPFTTESLMPDHVVQMQVTESREL